jgi:hypothetical protein
VPVRRRLRAMARRIAASIRRRPAQGYERPEAPDVTIDSVAQTPEEGAEAILEVLHERGFLRPAAASTSPPSGRLAAAEAT